MRKQIKVRELAAWHARQAVLQDAEIGETFLRKQEEKKARRAMCEKRGYTVGLTPEEDLTPQRREARRLRKALPR